MAVNGEGVRGRGEIACGYVENSSSCCGLCGDVDGRDRRRLRGTAGGAAWKLTHAGGAGEAVAGPWSVKLPGFSGCWESEWRA